MTLQQRRVLSGFRAIPLAILALLLVSCSTLTPDRIQVLAQIAGAAAQLGAQEWLAKHPDHKAAFDLVIAQIRQKVAQGVIDPAEYVPLLESLPTSHFSAKDGDLMWSGVSKSGQGVARLFVWDGPLQKTVPIDGKAVLAVMKATTLGMRTAMAPVPPMPTRLKRPVLRVTPEPALPELGIAPEAPPVPMPVQWITNTWRHPYNTNAEVDDATLDAEFQRYLVGKTNKAGTKKIRIIHPVAPQVPVK